MFRDFKDFIARGNVMDLALVVIIAGALWWWAPQPTQSPAEAVGRVPTEEVVERSVPEIRLSRRPWIIAFVRSISAAR